MYSVTPLRLFALLNPAIGLVFALVFLVLWTNHRNQRHILLMAAAAGLYTVAVLAQMFLPLMPKYGVNTMVSAVLYMTCLALFIEALLMRVGVRGNVPWLALLAGGILCLIAFFFYVHEDLRIRIYVLNLGCGALLVFGALRLRLAPDPKPIDRVLFWTVLLVGLHFLPRTLLTLFADGPNGTASIENYRASLFFSLLNFALIILALLLCLTFLLAIALDIIEELRTERNRDALVPLLNRRGFEEQASAYLVRALPERACLVFCDIDHFKAINDTYGHATGDAVIRAFGRWIGEAVRRDDVAGRIGGEEFAILLPGAAVSDAVRFCERLRLRVEAGEEGIIPAPWQVTSSFGIAERRLGDTLAELMARADQRLYAAKRNGRNRVEG